MVSYNLSEITVAVAAYKAALEKSLELVEKDPKLCRHATMKCIADPEADLDAFEDIGAEPGNMSLPWTIFAAAQLAEDGLRHLE